MEPRQEFKLHNPVKTAVFASAVLLSFLLTGCVWNSPWVRREPEVRLSANPTKAELVEHLNENIERVQSWRSTNVRISAKGPGVMPVPLSGTISVENPKNFRLTVESIGGREADLGCNPDRFWIWMKRSNINRVVTCRHDQIDRLQSALPIPFEPDWIMEALGVVPIDPASVRQLEADPDTGYISLVATERGPDSLPVRRVILVDPQNGRIVAQTLHDEMGRTIAQATFDDYHYDAQSGTNLPHRIDLDWPETRVRLTLRFDQIEVNPENLPQQTWHMPANLPVLDLGRQIPRMASAQTEPPGRVRLGASREDPIRFAANNSPHDTTDSSEPRFEKVPRFNEPAWYQESSQLDSPPQFDDESSHYRNEPPFTDTDVPRFDDRNQTHDLTEVPQFDDDPDVDSSNDFQTPFLPPVRDRNSVSGGFRNRAVPQFAGEPSPFASRNGSIQQKAGSRFESAPKWGRTSSPNTEANGEPVDRSWWR